MRRNIVPIGTQSWSLDELKKGGYGHLSRYTHCDPAMGLDETTLLGYLNSFAGNKGECWPRRDKTILRELGWGRVKYDNALRNLKAAEYVRTAWAIRQGTRVYLFTLLEPEAAKRLQTKIAEKDSDHPKYAGLDKHGFGYVYKTLATAAYLSGGAKGVLFYLLSRMGHTGETRLNYSLIKDQLNIKSDRTVHTYLQELICCGLIRTEKIRKAGKFHKIRFIFVPAIKKSPARKEISAVDPNSISFFADQPAHKITTGKKTAAKKQSDNKTISPVEDKPLPSVDLSLSRSLSINDPFRRTVNTINRKYYWDCPDMESAQQIVDWQKAQPKKIAAQVQSMRDWETTCRVISEQMGIEMSDKATLTRCIDYDIWMILSRERTIPVDLVQDPQITRRVVRVLTRYRCNDDIQSVLAKRELTGDIEDALTRLLNESKTGEFMPKFCDIVFGRRTKAVNIMLRLLDHLYANMSGRQDIKNRAAYIRHSVVNFFREYDIPWSEIPYKKDAAETNDTSNSIKEALPARYEDFIRIPTMKKHLPNIMLLNAEEYRERSAAYVALSPDERDEIFISELEWIWYVLPADYASFVAECLCEVDQQSIMRLSQKDYRRCKTAYEAMTTTERSNIWDGDHGWLLGDTEMYYPGLQEAI